MVFKVGQLPVTKQRISKRNIKIFSVLVLLTSEHFDENRATLRLTAAKFRRSKLRAVFPDHPVGVLYFIGAPVVDELVVKRISGQSLHDVTLCRLVGQ